MGGERTEYSGGTALSRYGNCDTCRGVMRAYALYRYDTLKSRYEHTAEINTEDTENGIAIKDRVA